MMLTKKAILQESLLPRGTLTTNPEVRMMSMSAKLALRVYIGRIKRMMRSQQHCWAYRLKSSEALLRSLMSTTAMPHLLQEPISTPVMKSKGPNFGGALSKPIFQFRQPERFSVTNSFSPAKQVYFHLPAINILATHLFAGCLNSSLRDKEFHAPLYEGFMIWAIANAPL